MASSTESPGALFRLCPGCGSGKIYRDDAHSLCIYCLHIEAHVISGCEICQGLPSGTRRDRARRVALRFSTSTGKTSSPLSSSNMTEEGDSSEPPPKKRAIDQSAGGPRPTHKSSRSPSQKAQVDPRLQAKPGSRWDVKHGERQPPSTVGVVPSPGTETRRRSPSRTVTMSTTTVQSTPVRATPPATAQTDARGHAPTDKVPPLRLVIDQGLSPAQSGDRPSEGHKTLPTPMSHAPQQEAWQEALDLAMGTIKTMVDQHQKSLRRVKTRLADHQDAAKVASQQESERMQSLLQQQQAMFRDELCAFQEDADKRAAERSDKFRREMEELKRTCAQPPSDPVQEMQKKELAALKKRQQEEKDGDGVLIVYSDGEEEEEEEGDGAEYLYDPDNDPYDPVDEPPAALVDPHGDEPGPPVDIGGLPRSPTPRPPLLRTASRLPR